MLQLQEAVAAAHTDASVLKVINQLVQEFSSMVCSPVVASMMSISSSCGSASSSMSVEATPPITG